MRRKEEQEDMEAQGDRTMRKANIKPIDIMPALGKVYSKTVNGYASFSLAAILRTAESEHVHKKAKHIALAMTRMGLLIKDGRNHRYRWNRQRYGVPSIPLAEEVIRQADDVQTMYTERAMRKAEAAKRCTFQISIKRKARRKENCDGCPYTEGCEVFSSLGINCKAYDLNTIEHETAVGC